MAERDTIIDKLRLNYEGLFDVKELYKLIENYFEDHNYDKRENKHIEVVKPEGKFIEVELEPWKKYTDYYRNIIHIRMIMQEVKEVEIEKDNLKIKVNQGKVQIVIDGYVETDYENRWESKPILFFIRTLYNKIFFKPYTLGYHASVRQDVNTLHQQLKQFFNIYRT